MIRDTIMLDPASTALMLVDLQNMIVELPLAPVAGRVLAAAAADTAARFRAAGATVVLVQADLTGDPRGALHQPVDMPIVHPEGDLPAGWEALVDGLSMPWDVIVTKRQWGGFYGTDLDLQLRRRRIETVVVGGIATNFGVESTVRAAGEHGYAVIVAEDLTASFTAEMHEFALREIFARIARVRLAASLGFVRA